MTEEYIKNVIRKYLKAKAEYDLCLQISCGNKLEAAKNAYDMACDELRAIVRM